MVCGGSTDRDGKSYKHFAKKAAWRATTLDFPAFCARYNKPGMHGVMQYLCMRGGAALWADDLLHIVHYNGTAGHAVANVLYEMIHSKDNCESNPGPLQQRIRPGHFNSTFRLSSAHRYLFASPTSTPTPSPNQPNPDPEDPSCSQASK